MSEPSKTQEVARETEAALELFDLGWLHDWAKSDAFARNPHRA